LGIAPAITGLRREDVLVLAALGRRPLGLGSARAVARAAGVSPTTAGRSLNRLVDVLATTGRLVVQQFQPQPGRQTLNVLLDATRLQFLEASSLRVLEPLHAVAGVMVAGVGDLLAMKLKVICDGGELRDYFDLLAIEQQGHRRVEEGIALALEKYRPKGRPAFVQAVVRGLGYLDDVQEDPGVPIPRAEVAAYWERRVPEIVRALSRHG
jgi:hypothetical protein